MANSKKSLIKLPKKVQKIIKGDVVKSVAIASVLLNVLFIATIFVFTATDSFDRSVYVGARTRYCQNQASINDRTAELGSEVEALREREVDCIGAGFKPFYQEALDKYQAELNK